MDLDSFSGAPHQYTPVISTGEGRVLCDINKRHWKPGFVILTLNSLSGLSHIFLQPPNRQQGERVKAAHPQKAEATFVKCLPFQLWWIQKVWFLGKLIEGTVEMWDWIIL